ncbi:transketolase [Kribbella orskensis]|uniref:Transketolase n=1 Tax=Kribbella orskensis TaxID=2512216 RepID=A0ABY2BH61_9ACTN|nr:MULTISPECIES: transketolase [Kribbella]TCN38333.1 transketolase [Kribbella sp. VKM Ac-2500]TCO20137.1 transketolase [Kribbella orskensis]
MLTSSRPQVEQWQAFRDRVRDAGRDERALLLATASDQIRRDVLTMIERAGLGHVGGDFSVTDILVTLYASVLSVAPAEPDWPDRDRLILSKGHSAAALYATLASCGFFPATELATFMAPLSALSGHPDRTKVPGIETNTGPLGHGLPIGVGTALAARLRNSPARTVVILGDGELQEGSNWEAAMCAGHHRLGSLTAVVDRNGLQQGARTEDTNALEPLADRWRSFGWSVAEVDGHDHAALAEVFAVRSDRPTAVIAHTQKGRGVSFMTDRVEWHHKVPSRDELALARAELSR